MEQRVLKVTSFIAPRGLRGADSFRLVYFQHGGPLRLLNNYTPPCDRYTV